MKKAVILLSGGLDSTTVLAYAKNEGFDCYGLSFSYGQKHNAELSAAKKIAAHFNAVHKVFNLELDEFSSSALTDATIPIADYDVKNTSIPKTYVPARNTIFLSIALAFAETIGANDIFIGVSHVDYSGYPDCRPQYIEAFQHLANLATKKGVEEGGITIHAPLIYLSKAQTILLGHSLGVDYAMTVTCYKADDRGYACGQCDACTFRKRGFVEAQIADVTCYG